MLTNGDISNVYINSGRSKNRVVQLLCARTQKSVKEVCRIADNWIQQFLRRWAGIHSRQKFVERQKKLARLSICGK